MWHVPLNFSLWRSQINNRIQLSYTQIRCKHIQTETKWPSFCRRYFQIHFQVAFGTSKCLTSTKSEKYDIKTTVTVIQMNSVAPPITDRNIIENIWTYSTHTHIYIYIYINNQDPTLLEQRSNEIRTWRNDVLLWCVITHPFFNVNGSSSSSSKFYFQQNTTMEQYQEKENTL